MKHERFSCGDINRLAAPIHGEVGVAYPGLSDSDVLVSGCFSLSRMRSGLILHATDTVEQRDAVITIDCEPSITIFLILDGVLRFSAEGREFIFAGESRRGRIAADGRIVVSTRPTVLKRQCKLGARIRKVQISVGPDWLENEGSGLALEGLAREHLAVTPWRISARAVAIAEQILNPPDTAPFLRAMYLESRTIELAALAIEALAGGSERADAVECPTRTALRAHAARKYIDTHLGEPLTLLEIAQHAGFSVSSLQRHFKAAFGTTVVDYLRGRKLAQARDALEKHGASVSEAAFLAGYTNPSSFATAFKKTYGMSPKALRR